MFAAEALGRLNQTGLHEAQAAHALGMCTSQLMPLPPIYFVHDFSPQESTAMSRSLLLVTVFLFASPSSMAMEAATAPPKAQKATADLEKKVKAAVDQFSKAINAEVAKAEAAGDVGSAAALSEWRTKVSDRYALVTEPDPAADAAPIDPKTLKKLFNAREATFAKDGSLVLSYDFSNAKQLRDFKVPAVGVKVQNNILMVDGALQVDHKAKWTGNFTLRCEIAHANRAGTYLVVGTRKVTGGNYNSWNINLDGVGGAKFSGDYTQTGDLNSFRPLVFTLSPAQVLLEYGFCDNTPVRVAGSGSTLRGEAVQLHGAAGGALFKGLTLIGTLDPDWLTANAP